MKEAFIPFALCHKQIDNNHTAETAGGVYLIF